MKKVFVSLMSMLLVFCMCAPLVAKAEEGTKEYKGFTYEVWEGEGGAKEIFISGYTGTDAEVVVPGEIEGTPVKVVQFEFPDGNSTMTSLKFSEGIEVIYPFTATGASALKTVYIPSTVTSIGQAAFLYCDNLKDIIVDDKNEAFCDEDGVLYAKFNMYENDQLIKDEKGNPKVFADCSLYPRGKRDAEYTILSEVDGCPVIQIAERAFHGNQDIRSIIIPDSVVDIYYMAFGDCINLEKLTFLGAKSTAEYDDYSKKYYDIVGLLINSDGADEMKVVYPETLVLYVVKDSEMEKYAVANNIPYKYAQPAVSLNEEFKIQVEGNTLDSIPYGTEVLVKDITASTNEKVKTQIGTQKYKSFDISLQYEATLIQPKDSVKVSIPVPENFDGTKCNVYHVSDKGEFTDMKAKFDNGRMVFLAYHFSNYVIVEGSIGATASPKTGDGAQTMLWVAMMCMSVGAYGIYSKKTRSYN